jgi:hypothetical protein
MSIISAEKETVREFKSSMFSLASISPDSTPHTSTLLAMHGSTFSRYAIESSSKCKQAAKCMHSALLTTFPALYFHVGVATGLLPKMRQNHVPCACQTPALQHSCVSNLTSITQQYHAVPAENREVALLDVYQPLVRP